MFEKKLSSFIYFGTSFRYLQDAKEGWRIRGKNRIVYNINQFFDRLDEFELVVTKRASRDLRTLAKELQKATHEKLTAAEARELHSLMSDIRKTLMAEAGGKIAYVVSDKRFQVEKLTEGPSALFADGVFEALSELARHDLGEAAKCIAFERPTAAAFHLLRATEAVLQDFFRQQVKKRRGELMWGHMLKRLREKKKPPPKELLDHLDNIRANFRNPTAHPDKIYSVDEAQDLLFVCIDVINRMSGLIRPSTDPTK